MLIVARLLNHQLCMKINPADCGQPGTTITLARLYFNVLLNGSKFWTVERMLDDLSRL